MLAIFTVVTYLVANISVDGVTNHHIFMPNEVLVHLTPVFPSMLQLTFLDIHKGIEITLQASVQTSFYKATFSNHEGIIILHP